MSIRVQLEIGHTAALKTNSKNNFTHDWELYVKGVEKADISSYVEKIVFNLHESFPKPKRTFKEPPYVLKESGYAGFILPIDIHFKNRTMQTYQYDIDLQPSGPPVHKCEIKKHIFENPSEDFRQKLLRGGGVLLGNSEEERNRNVDIDFPHKIKSSSSNLSVGHDSSKKSHKMRPEKNKVQNFENIFGKPITKTSTPPPTVNPNITSLKSSMPSQEQKIRPTNANISQIGLNSSKLSNQNKLDKVLSNPNLSNTKEKIEVNEKLEKKEKHKHSSHKDKEKSKKEEKDRKEDKHDRREDRERKKDKSHSKERDRSSEKTSKNRTESPQRKKPRASSPINAITNISRKSPSRSSSSASKEENKNKIPNQTSLLSLQNQSQSHQPNANLSQSTDTDKKSSISSSKKSKKEKKSHEKDKERDSRRERESKNQKDVDQASRSSSTVSYQGSSGGPTILSGIPNNNNIELNKIHKQDTSSIKSSSKSKAEQKVMTEAINPLPIPNPTNSVPASKKISEKHENEEKRHKHKKKEKSKDKDKEKVRDKESTSLKDKEKKRDKKVSKEDSKKTKEEDVGSNATSSSNLGPTESLHDSLFNSDHESRYSDTDKLIHHSENSNHTFVGKLSKSKAASQNNVSTVHKSQSSNTVPTFPISSNDIAPTSTEKKEKKNKDQKVEKEDKKRKRKSREGIADLKPPSSGTNILESQPKIPKKGVVDSKKFEKHLPPLLQHHIPHQPPVIQPVDSFRAPSVSSGSSISSSSVPILHHAGVARTNINSGNIANTGFDLDYISELKELQEKIMTLQDNNELQKVVEIIAATGRFEITSKTFDFDLCALDRNTIQRLHVIV